MGGTLASFAGLNALFRATRWEPNANVDSIGLSPTNGPLALPIGFSCHVIGRAFDTMSDGLRAPSLPDGMACFQSSEGAWVLVRNHEIARAPRLGAFPRGQPRLAFSPRFDGGVSRLVLDPASLAVRHSNLLLTGTHLNCGGGPSPWGWLTCEESEESGHGWVFLCDPGATELKPPNPLPGYGRFRHEAVAVDKQTLIAYLTEDQGDGCLYRFVPHSPTAPFLGVLEAARVRRRPNFQASTQAKLGERLEIEWVSIADPRAEERTTRAQGHEAGAASIKRGEGIWFDDGGPSGAPSVVFTSTTGGRAGKGQVFRLRLGRVGSPDCLELVTEAPLQGGLAFPDNVTIAPWGDPIIAEDGDRPDHIRGIRPDGSTYAIARNVLTASEFAGVCFSPDGSTLFCNLQQDGLTLAIRGPWDTLRDAPWS